MVLMRHNNECLQGELDSENNPRLGVDKTLLFLIPGITRVSGVIPT